MGVCARSTIPSHYRPVSDSKFEVRSGTCWRRSAPGSSRREQPFFNPMQTFPSGFGEGRVGANNIANHLPGREVERTLRRRSHGQRNRALRAETDALGRGFLPRPYTRRLCEHKHGHRFFAGLDLTAAAKAIQIVQRLCLLSTKFCSSYCPQTLPFAQETAERFPHTKKTLIKSRFSPCAPVYPVVHALCRHLIRIFLRIVNSP